MVNIKSIGHPFPEFNPPQDLLKVYRTKLKSTKKSNLLL